MAKAKQTRAELVRSMLTKPGGARLAAICKATGWQAHSARAMLSGLRKAGYEIERTAAGDKGGGSVYRITASPKTQS